MGENLERKLQAYAETDAYAFHMPGHKRILDPLRIACGTAAESPMPPGSSLELDITEIDGFDNLHDAKGVLRDEMEAVARMYGVRETLFSVNGSTCALLAAISAAVPKRGTILIERACHMAVYHAAYLRELDVLYVEDAGGAVPKDEAPVSLAADVRQQSTGGEAPGLWTNNHSTKSGDVRRQSTGGEAPGRWAYNHSTKSGDVRQQRAGVEVPDGKEMAARMTNAALRDGDSHLHDGTGDTKSDTGKYFDAVVITSPTYEGCMKDVRGWAEYAHARGAALIVDEAHGAHLGFHPYFPQSAVSCGADVVVQSTHKTLPAMTQTALLHNVTGRVPGGRLRFFMDIYETSSPSYVLMASITSSLRLVRERGDELFGKYADRLRRIRRELGSLLHFRLAGGEEAVLSREDELPPYRSGTRMDPGKLVLTGSGPWLYGRLRERYHLQMEMCTDRYCLAMTSIADTDEGFDRLILAMREIDGRMEREMTSQGENLRDAGMTENQAAGIAEAAAADVMNRGDVLQCCAVPVLLSGGQMKISDALDAPSGMAVLDDAVGRVCADFVILYPPDVPLIVPGEVYTAETVGLIRKCMEQGLGVLGISSVSGGGVLP